MLILIFLNCNKLHYKTDLLSVNISPQSEKYSRQSGPSIDTLRPFRDPDRFFKAQLQYQNPYFELDIEQDENYGQTLYQTGN